MRSLTDERAAMAEMLRLQRADRVSLHPLPSAPEFLAEHAPEALPLLDYTTPGTGDVCVCTLHRGRKKYLDNVIGRCQDCQELIEYRPDVPRQTQKLCVFCALRYVRGDA